MSQPFQTEALQRAIVTVRAGANCSVCQIRRGPYFVEYPNLHVRYCGVCLPLGLADNIKRYKGPREDIIEKIQRDGGRLRDWPKEKRFNAEDKRYMRAHFWEFSEEQLKEAEAWNEQARPKSQFGGRTVAEVYAEEEDEEQEDEEGGEEEDDEDEDFDDEDE